MELHVMFEGREVGRLRYGSGTAYFAYSRDWLNYGLGAKAVYQTRTLS